VVTGQAMTRGGAALGRTVAVRGLKFGLGSAAFVAASLCLLPRQLLWISLGGLDDSERQTIQPLAVELLRYAAVYCVADVCGLILASAAKGMNRTSLILVATAVPGLVLMGLGWATAPIDAGAATHWWGVMVLWAASQPLILMLALFSPWRTAGRPNVDRA